MIDIIMKHITNNKMTALQELRIILENNRNWSADFIFNAIDELLEKEKQQIMDAYDLGSLEDLQYPDSNVINNGEQYYNETFNNLNK